MRHAGPGERSPALPAAAAASDAVSASPAHEVSTAPALVQQQQQQRDALVLKKGTVMGAVALITGSTVGAG